MSQQPSISVLMPVRNEERFLPAALDSLFKQTMTSWELVVVDDGSSDATPDILAESQRNDSRIHVVRSPGAGLVAALNTGLESCRAATVARMDGDDICHPRRLELQAAYLDSHPDTGLVASRFRHFPRKDLKQGMIAYESWQNSLDSHTKIMRDIFVESPFVHPSIACRTDILRKAGGYRDCGWPEDYDLWLRLAAMGVRFGRLHESLFFWRDHPSRSTRTMSEYSLEAFRRCRMHHLMNSFLSGISQVVIAGAGQEGRAWHRLLSQNGIAVSAWIDVDPRKVGRMLHGSPVVSTDMISSLRDRILVAIGVRGARDQFRELISPLGLHEGLDFICVS
jgi:glycosyltransferase involved in cell wall biosynthesis